MMWWQGGQAVAMMPLSGIFVAIYVCKYLLDSGYPLEPWLMTPYREERVVQHRNFNRVHCSARNITKQCFGVLKSRFRCLHETGGILQQSPVKACKIVTDCAAFHNFCLKCNDVHEYEDDETDAGDIPPDDLNSDIDTPPNLRESALSFCEELSIFLKYKLLYFLIKLFLAYNNDTIWIFLQQLCDVESHIFYIYLSIINFYSKIIVTINYV